ncbi:MAG: cytochrome B [Micavibrio aeruginosavorus]|uniref:Cytochrome B n=1 Tax=Micavibrio aeruginosavorus TaxID=349221 RepID=A0A2W5Q0E5_9BACT|nr:MAG: cytochrome B [Micavibrio aeruginosavorus]
MGLANSENEYGIAAKSFHWLIAVLIIGLLPVGIGMGMLPNEPFKFQIYALHKSFGLLVFFLGIGRIIWRFVSPPPEHLETHAHWETTLAGAAHFWLYVCIIGMPLSGWLMSNAGEFPVPFFGIQMPHLIGKDEALGDLFGDVHELLGYTLLLVLALHVAGAIKHHVLDKDETLKRMAYAQAGIGFAAFIVLVLGLSYFLSLGVLLQKFTAAKPQEVAAAPETPAAVPVASQPSTANLPPHGWAIVPDVSHLQFEATLYGAAFTGDLKQYDGTIIFDPADLSTAKADITIHMANVATGDAERDSNIVGEDWFDAMKFPQAHFVATKFEKGDGNNYVAIGNLTIRDKTMPLILPFTLDIAQKTAHMVGEADLNRTDFGVGQGEWEDESAVLHAVKVKIDLKAVQ